MKIRKMLLFFVLFVATLPKITSAHSYDYQQYQLNPKMDPSLYHQLMPMYVPLQQKEFTTNYQNGIKRKYFASQKLVSLEKRRKSWPTERRKNYHAQLDAAEVALNQLNKPCKNNALTNLRNRINNLKDRINVLQMMY